MIGREETYKLALLLWCHRSVNSDGASIPIGSGRAWLRIVSFLLVDILGLVTYDNNTLLNITLQNVNIKIGSIACISVCYRWL